MASSEGLPDNFESAHTEMSPAASEEEASVVISQEIETAPTVVR